MRSILTNSRTLLLLFFIINILLFIPAAADEAVNNPVKTDIAPYSKYLSQIKDYDLAETAAIGYDKIIYSPLKTKKLYIKSTDPTVVPYEKSSTTISVFSANGPLSIIKFGGYKSYNLNWINEELLHLEIWPGRCIELDEIINLNETKKIYSSAFNHCGTEDQ